MMRNRDMLLKEIQQLSFRLYDLTLFLDTHPNEQCAIKDYNETLNKYKSMVRNFEKLYGPLTLKGVDENAMEWKWIKGPWPWENCICEEENR